MCLVFWNSFPPAALCVNNESSILLTVDFDEYCISLFNSELYSDSNELARRMNTEAAKAVKYGKYGSSNNN